MCECPNCGGMAAGYMACTASVCDMQVAGAIFATDGGTIVQLNDCELEANMARVCAPLLG